MFDLRLVQQDGLFSFNRQLPFFNWYYPFDVDQDRLTIPLLPFLKFEKLEIKRCAAYVHIPFCETVCSFCPFTRGKYRIEQEIQDYVDAIIREIKFKHSLIGRAKVDVIFVGGGTPSVLNSEQIEVLGRTLHTFLDTSDLAEFTFELEVKSVTREKLEAMRRIGVNRVSFGAQTFSARHRRLFSLDATVGQIHCAAEIANEFFEYTNVDMIYGMAGQSAEELRVDITEALCLRTTTIDFYPLNNLAAQVRMHRLAQKMELQPLPAAQRLQYRRDIDEYLRGRGYSPINGYGYARIDRSKSATIQHLPKFQYHDIVYGYHDDAVLGYGSSALTQLPGYNVYNHASRTDYISRVRDGALHWEAFRIGDCYEKGVVTFPYRGILEKSRISLDILPPETYAAFQETMDAGLVREEDGIYRLTEHGWLVYVNLMYYLMPAKGKTWISNRIVARMAAGHECEHTAL
jgi:coproporphyrinogen III oxidase-like Fe-S oxidoreductase